MRKTTTTSILAGAAVLLIGHVSGCTDGFLDGIHRDPATFPARQSVDVNLARQQLAGLTVIPEGSADGYDRDLFPHWSTVSGRCNTREVVLQEQGQNVRVDNDCRATSGTWISPYDGAVWTDASDVDVDHMVPLAEAWESGADRWSERQREGFANNLGPHGDGHPQLVVVTDNANSSKGQRDPGGPDGYRPPLRTYWCAYAADWVAVKAAYGLTVDPAEVAALDEMLGTCGGAQ